MNLFFYSQIMIKLNIKVDRRSISLRELRSHFDHAPAADNHQGLDQYAPALELAGSIMFPDNSGDSVPVSSADFNGRGYKIIYLS
jgi:hypothetical protein